MLHTSGYMFAWVHVSKFCNLFKIFMDLVQPITENSGNFSRDYCKLRFPRLLSRHKFSRAYCKLRFPRFAVRSQVFPRLLQATFSALAGRSQVFPRLLLDLLVTSCSLSSDWVSLLHFIRRKLKTSPQNSLHSQEERIYPILHNIKVE